MAAIPLDISIDFLGQVPRMIGDLIGIRNDAADRQRERRHEFFADEIAPAHEAMEAVHTDYTESFAELLGLLKSETDLARIIELLKEKRLATLMTRKEREAYSEALKQARKSGYMKRRELADLVAYAEAVREYLVAAMPVDSRVTWYTAFIDGCESLARKGESPFGRHLAAIETSKPPVDIVRAAFSEAIQHDLPEAWKNYTTAYFALRLELNR